MEKQGLTAGSAVCPLENNLLSIISQFHNSSAANIFKSSPNCSDPFLACFRARELSNGDACLNETFQLNFFCLVPSFFKNIQCRKKNSGAKHSGDVK